MNHTKYLNAEDINNEKYTWSTFRSDLQDVCGEYMVGHTNQHRTFKYQVWQFDEAKDRVLLRILLTEIDDIGECELDPNGQVTQCNIDKMIVYNSESEEIMIPSKEQMTDIHRKLKDEAIAFNDYYHKKYSEW